MPRPVMMLMTLAGDLGLGRDCREFRFFRSLRGSLLKPPFFDLIRFQKRWIGQSQTSGFYAPDPAFPLAPRKLQKNQSLGVRCWQGMTGRVFDRMGIKDGDQGWGGFCAWWRPGSRSQAEASTCW